METNYVPRVGDIILVRSNSWLPRAIQFFMRYYRRTRGYKQVTAITNHAACILDLWGVLMVSESTIRGVEATKTASDYIAKHKVIIKRYKGEIPSHFSKVAASYFASPHKYDFLNFLYQMIMVLTGFWIGPKHARADRRLYCSEYIAVIFDDLFGIYKGETWNKNPLDLDITPEFETVYKNF